MDKILDRTALKENLDRLRKKGKRSPLPTAALIFFTWVMSVT